MTDTELVELLFKAYHSDLGIVVTTTDVKRLRTKLYEARKPYPELITLTLSPNPLNPDTSLMILKNAKTTPPETHPEPPSR